MQIVVLILATVFAVCMSGCKSESNAPRVDTTSPVVSIISPSSSSTVVDSTILAASATDDVGVTKIEFYLDGTILHACPGPPWQYMWNLQLIPDNTTHSVIAKAYDAANNVGTSPTVTVLVKGDTSNPVVSITSPAQNSVVVDSVVIIASVFDVRGVQRVEFIIDGSLALSRLAQPWAYSWNVLGIPDNTWHTITAKAFDNFNNSAISSGVGVLVRADTTRPVTSIISPSSNAVLSDSVLLEASASDNRQVIKVEFYVDGILSGNCASPPWDHWWIVEGLPENSTHLILSKAYDSYNNVGTSSPVPVVVINNRALTFDGSSTLLRLGAPLHLTSFGSQITVESWVRLFSYGNGGTIIASGNQNEYALGVTSTGKPVVTMAFVNPMLNHQFIGRTTLAINTWYHVAFSYDGSQESIIVNGALDTSVAVSGNVNSSQNNDEVCIGGHMNNSQTVSFLHALLDDFRVWSTSRTPAQIQANMNSELTGTEANLEGNWKFNGNINDSSPHHFLQCWLSSNDTVYVHVLH